MKTNENITTKQLSNSVSTGGLGVHFENRVQTSFVILMLAGGFSACLPPWPIEKIKLQGKYQGYETDDLIVYSKHPYSEKQAKLLGQIKHSISITKGNKEFAEVIQSAWRDFNNQDLFSEETDVIALICGPLSAIDTNDVRSLLNQARYSENHEDFITRINLGNFTSNKQRVKLEVFKSQLKSANKNVELTNEQLWRFLKSFHILIYDLDIKGVVLSLLYTLIEQHSHNNSNALFAQIKDHVEWQSENAGFITLTAIPEEIRSAFERKPMEVMPKGLAINISEVNIRDWNHYIYANELTIACILGSWDEKSDADKEIISDLVHEDYKNWIIKLREILQLPDSPLVFKNSIWSIKNRKELWESLWSRIFDDDLDCFKQCVVTVLSECDPRFELVKEERFAASIYGKVMKYSNSLRKGLAESLALIGCFSSSLTNCSLNKAEGIAVLSLREILSNANWILWASLSDLLPLLAEAAPDEFLENIEVSLLKIPCPFVTIFEQEGDGITGWNYLTGLLWALETLAWEEEFLVRVTVILGELACHDPGGNWANRPSNSLSTIFLPWYPQTIASIEKRIVAVQTLCKEVPEVAWKLLISLLPNQHQVSTGSHKPIWRNSIPESWTGKVTNKEYWEQISLYGEFAVDQAKKNMKKLIEIIDNLDNLPKTAFEKVLIYLSSDSINRESDDIKLGLWTALINFTTKHERYSEADWALDSALVSKIKEVANRLEPKNPINLYSRLFNNDDFDLYEEDGDWEAQEKQLENRRCQALESIIVHGGIYAVFKLIEIVESPAKVGSILGIIDENSFDSIIIPDLLITDNKKIEQFSSAYVWSRYKKLGWKWVDSIEKKGWSELQAGSFFICLPFTKNTWERVSSINSDAVEMYWNKVYVRPYQLDSEVNLAVDNLIKYSRPNAAIDCLYKDIHDKRPIDKARAIRALLSAISSSEPSYTMNTYHIVKIIEALQNDSTTNTDDLFHVEWAYLPILNRHHKARPILLENRLANNSSFFCEVIRLIYRSKKAIDKQTDLSEEKKAIATNAWNLLYSWHTPPGLQDDGSFNSEKFVEWLEDTKKECDESGHLEVALIEIGKVLFYSPPDPSGLWINRVVAEALNEKDLEKMRNGFCTEIYNSRGAHWVDPTGKPERELALKYEQKADEVENAGYQRFAAALRGVADTYNREAERIIYKHSSGDEEL